MPQTFESVGEETTNLELLTSLKYNLTVKARQRHFKTQKTTEFASY